MRTMLLGLLAVSAVANRRCVLSTLASIRLLKLMLHVAFNAAIRSRSFSEFAVEPFNRGRFLQFVGPYTQDIFQIGRIGLAA
jgi:hypothetical protein